MYILAALLLATSTPAVAPVTSGPDLEAVRPIRCTQGTGTGFLIGDDILVTAAHVADAGTNCKDGKTGAPLTAYYVDGKRDFAIMTGDLPDVQYLSYDCKPFVKGSKYISYGWSSYKLPSYGFHHHYADPVGEYEDVIGIKGMAVLKAWNRPGHSGGPIIRKGTNVVIGMVNAGAMNPFTGAILGTTYSVEIRSTVLCD